MIPALRAVSRSIASSCYLTSSYCIQSHVLYCSLVAAAATQPDRVYNT